MKARLAVYWTGSCGGCDVSFLELGPGLFDVLPHIEIVFWPALMDAKRRDLEVLSPRSIDFSLVNGVIRTAENREMVELLREKSKYLGAYGACAHLGGIPALANQVAGLLELVFGPGFRPSPPPGGEAEDALPDFLPQTLSLEEVVPVDFVVPGCPPPAPLIAKFFETALSGEISPAQVFAKEKALCEECPRQREERRITKLVRPHEILADPQKCLLDQGIVCLGPVTRGGCEAACPKAGMPCTGCLGPTPKAGDPALAMVSALASLVRAGEEGESAFPEEDRILDGLVDPIGTLYKYAFAKYARPLMKLARWREEVRA
ncbi:MAG: oxidoreductase [Candidatus Bipolaricaulaceae bacterium]